VLSGNANELAHGGGGPGKGSLSCLTVSPVPCALCGALKTGVCSVRGVGTHQRPWNRIARREGWMAGIAPHFF